TGDGPRRQTIDVVGETLEHDLRGRGLVRHGELAQVQQGRREAMTVAEHHAGELPQGARGGLEQPLALREGTEPIRREQPWDLPLELLLLEIQASLAPLDPGEQIADGHAQRPFDRAPLVRPLDLAGRGAELFELVDERLAQDRQALAREHLLFEEELDDARRQTGERKLAGTRDAGT